MSEDSSKLREQIAELEKQNAVLREENAALKEEARMWKRKLTASRKQIELIHDLSREAIEEPPPN